jgi:tungstate transport system substrate-binding protein
LQISASSPLRFALLAPLLVLLPVLAALAALASGCGAADDRDFITLASTTSTENSGLLGAILPRFTEASGVEVRVVAVGTGAAIRLAEGGDADVLLVHDRASEEAFVAEGHGVERFDVMYNDFVVVGPKDDPAGVRAGAKGDVSNALRLIAEAEAPFVSRGDDSGTHKAERRLWKHAGLDPKAAPGGWYRETGSGMGAALNTANAMGAYTLSDRGTWLSFRNRSDLRVVLEGDPPLFNPYGVILVSPAKHPHVKAEQGQALIDWLLSEEGQRAIGEFRVDGEVLFHPDAKSADHRE